MLVVVKITLPMTSFTAEYIAFDVYTYDLMRNNGKKHHIYPQNNASQDITV